MAEYTQRSVGIVGGGPAGMMAAIHAVQNGARVTLFEKNTYLGKKLGITGKGRCNVTNDCDANEFLKNVIANPKFLYAAINNFSTADTKDFFENLGVPLKTERGRRVFPVSDKAADIVNALKGCVLDYGVRVVYERVTEIIKSGDRVTGVKTDGDNYSFDAVIIATGGASYPGTGSDGDGYRFARSLGIDISPVFPSLVPLETKEDVSGIMGLSLKNVTLKIVDKSNGKAVFSELGEMMFTHFGLTGPLVLSASTHMRDMREDRYTAYIDFKPALDINELDKRVISDFSKNINRDFSNSLGNLLPSKIIPYIIERSGIAPDTKVNEITKAQRRVFVELLKGLSLEITGFRPLREAIVTAGGISVKEISPSDMSSRKYKGLYFCGEVIDVDAYTGGYNLQIAFSTGALAGTRAAWGE